MIEISIPLPPLSWMAPIKGKHGFYDPREKEKRCARFYIKEQYKGVPLEGYVFVTFLFVFGIPKSASKKKKESMLMGQILPTKSDCTNLQKLYEDCLKGIVINDDRNVVEIYSKKIYGEKESIEITIYTLEELHADYNR